MPRANKLTGHWAWHCQKQWESDRPRRNPYARQTRYASGTRPGGETRGQQQHRWQREIAAFERRYLAPGRVYKGEDLSSFGMQWRPGEHIPVDSAWSAMAQHRQALAAKQRYAGMRVSYGQTSGYGANPHDSWSKAHAQAKANANKFGVDYVVFTSTGGRIYVERAGGFVDLPPGGVVVHPSVSRSKEAYRKSLGMNPYDPQSRPAWKYWTLSEVVSANRDAGGHFFDRATLRGFGETLKSFTTKYEGDNVYVVRKHDGKKWRFDPQTGHIGPSTGTNPRYTVDEKLGMGTRQRLGRRLGTVRAGSALAAYAPAYRKFGKPKAGVDYQIYRANPRSPGSQWSADRAAMALDMTFDVGDTSPRIAAIRNRIATVLDQGGMPALNDVCALEGVARCKGRHASRWLKRKFNPRKRHGKRSAYSSFVKAQWRAHKTQFKRLGFKRVAKRLALAWKRKHK